MLDAEEAKVRLDSIRIKDWREQINARASKLGKRRYRSIVSAVTEVPTSHTPAARKERQARLLQAATDLDGLNPDQLVGVMTILHPQLGPSLARWWTDAVAQPYTRGWLRRAFRAPGQPELSRGARIEDLFGLLLQIGSFDCDPVWLASWAPYLGSRLHAHAAVGPLLAAAIDARGPTGREVLQTLRDVGNGEHAIGMMGRHVVTALLRADRPEGWDYVERLLLAAQRQEGLRQVILEAIDEAHPAAFDRMLTVIVEQNLLRFAATVRAVGVWLGLSGDVTEIPRIADRVSQLRVYRSDVTTRREALERGDPWSTYIALCALAMIDVSHALEAVGTVLGRGERDVRAAAVRFLAAVALPSATEVQTSTLADTDVAVAMIAALLLDVRSAPPDTFERLAALATRLPARTTTVDHIGIESESIALARGDVVAKMMLTLGPRQPAVMLPWLPDMDVNTRVRFVSLLGQQPAILTPGLRDAIIAMVGDRSSGVRQAAAVVAGQLAISRSDALALEPLLTRSAGDLRRAVINLLSKQGPDGGVASAERLWASGNVAQRDAATELLAALGSSHKRVVESSSRMIVAGVSDRQSEHLATLTGDAELVDPGLGLYDPAGRAPLHQPENTARCFGNETTLRIASALDDLVETYRDTTLTLSTWQGSREVLLADAQWLPSPFFRRAVPLGAEDEDVSGLIMSETFRSWWSERPTELRADPLDALHAYAATVTASNRPTSTLRGFQSWQNENMAWWFEILRSQVPGSVGVIRHRMVVDHVLSWLILEDAASATVEECLAAAESALAAVPRNVIDQTPLGERPRILTAQDSRRREMDWRMTFANLSWLRVLGGLFARRPNLFSAEQLGRWFNVMRLIDEPIEGARRRPVPHRLVLAAFEVGVATDDDVYDALFNSSLLREMTPRRRDSTELRHPGAVVLADRLRDRIIEVEKSRGDLTTPASRLAYRVASVSGAELALDLLSRLGRAALQRGYLAGNEGRQAVYSHLLRVSFPGPTDTGDVLREIAARLKLRDDALVEFAMYSPQWATLIEEALGWNGLADAVWWFHAHSKDSQWSVSAEVRDLWAAQTAERTELSAADRIAGAVDVAWFTQCYSALSPERWKSVYRSAKLASGGSGHRRAQLFAEAMLGETDEAELATRMQTKRHQDSARALGLLPLTGERKDSDETIRRRYSLLREFERGSSKFGSQRQSSERTAVRIGIENLARSAGYGDPQRFVWATEAAESADLANGPIQLCVDDLTVSLSVDEEGLAAISVIRNGKTLAAVPTKFRKQPDIVVRRDRRTALVRQAGRVRTSLEAAMIRQEHFTPTELRDLSRHPIVAPMLNLLIFIDEGAVAMRHVGGSWITSAGETVVPRGELRLAHPIDLVGSGDWISWQEQMFLIERRQPFKQVFRELYVLTEAERATAPLSHRYEGHQIQPSQALALFGRRGWIHDREAGDVSKVFHDYDLVARIGFLDGFGTPAEVELPTIQTIGFTRRNSYVAEPFDSVHPLVFSEAMRDIDLVVSVAHAGGVDPEASASTVEMRAALVRETTRALKLGNVREVGTHVVIEGSLGEYSVHLGSGIVHRRPGGAVCIIPVDSQRRGRLFLPFADDDPKTAEVVSKILLLANDRQIKDPTILEQLRS